MESVRMELEAPVAILFVRAVEEEAKQHGWVQALHLRPSGRAQVWELRRGEDIVAVESEETGGHRVWVTVESETLDVAPLVEGAAGRVVTDVVVSLASALGRPLDDDTRARVQQGALGLCSGMFSTAGPHR